MADNSDGARFGMRKVRDIALISTALGCTIGIVGTASAQNISSLNNTTDYSLVETGTRSGGPRTIDVATSGGDITIVEDTVTVDNSSNVTGAGIAANNTGPGAVSITNGNVTATGTGLTYGIDARATTGTIGITNTGTVATSGNNGDIAIRAVSGGGNVTIDSNVATGQRRAIFVGGNGGTFGDTGITTINSTTATADGTGLVNAIVGQGYGVVINSGTASNTNAGGNQGTAIFANASAGGVVVNAGTTNAFGQNQAAIQIFSEGAVDLTSDAVRTTQNSDGLSVASGTDVVVRSNSVTTQGTGGARGIVIGGNAGGGGFNSGVDGFAYNSVAVTSGSISTVGNGAYGIYVTPNGTGTTAISSGDLTTTGANATGVLVTRIGNGAIGGATTIDNTGALRTSGTNAAGIQVNAGTGAVGIANSGSITTTGANSYGINVVPGSGATTLTGAGSIATSGDFAHAIYLNPAAGANTGAVSITTGPITTSGANAQGIYVLNAGGPVSIDASDIRTTGTGNAIIVQQTAGSTAPITVQAGVVRSAGPSAGINLSSNGTTGAITAGVVDSISVGSAIDARSVGAVALTGGTVQTTGTSTTGLVAISTGGTATVNSSNLTSANRGIYAQGLDNVSVNSGTLVSNNADYGLIARTSAASNNDPVVGTAEGVVNVTSGSLTATNIGINAFGPRATINVTSDAVTTLSGSAIQAFGIDVNVASNTITSGATGIEAGMGTGATRRGATVVTSNAIALNGTAGTTNGGITASGASVKLTSGTITATGAGNRFGISAQVPSTGVAGSPAAGTVIIDSGSITTVGDGAYGIQGITDAGALTINSTGTISTVGTTRMAGNQPRYSAGIIAVSGSGPITIASNAITTQGAQADAIRVEAGSAIASYNASANPGTAPISVTTTGLTQTSGANASGINVLGGGGAIGIVNSGTVAISGDGAFGIVANGGVGSVTIASNVVRSSGLGSQAIVASTTTGAISIDAGTTTNTGELDPNGNSAEAILASASGAGTITITSGTASSVGQFASAVFAQSNGGSVTINSGTATTGGASGDAVGGVARVAGDVAINANSTTATGTGATAIAGSAVAGNVTIVAGTASSAAGAGIVATAGRLASVTATSASAGGNGVAGVKAVGGTGVALNIGQASSNGTLVTTTNPRTGVVTVARADAIYASATTGTIDATIGSATATGAGADAVRLIANGAGGAVTANISGALSSTSGYGLFIDPPGAVVVNVGTGASIAGGLGGINTTGATNSITNLGSIAGTGGAAILAAGPTTLVNGGTLSGAGGIAVQLGASDDSVTLTTGSAVTGRIVGGGGTDAAFLSGTLGTASTAQTVAGFSGFDALTVQSGYWTADAANSSAFNTATISQGATLAVVNGAAGLTGVTAPVFVDNGTLVVRSDAASAGSTFGTSVVGGSGNVVFTGAGTATLDGTDSIASTGTITVDGGSALLVTGTQGGAIVTTSTGTLQVGDGGTTGMVTGTVADNGTLIVNRSDDATFAAALSGTGNFVKQGAGKLTFGTNYAFTGVTTIQAGSLRLSTPVAATTEIDLEGSGQLDLSGTTQRIAELSGASSAASINIAGGSLTDNQSTSTTFAGSIVGANASFTKAGTGSLNLTGASTYTGQTFVNGGRLAVNGSIVAPVLVNSGGTLGGTGSVGSTVIASGGTFAPGNSIGTITVNGNVAFQAGSTYAVEVNAAGASDRINATGTATLAGAVQVLAATGVYNQLTNYTILTAAGGINGKFAGVTTNFVFLSPLLSYGTNAVTLTLARNDTTFGSATTSRNQLAVANAVAARGLGDAVYNAVLFQTAIGAPAAFDQLSGELFASLPSELTDGGRRVREAVLNRGVAPGDGFGVWGDFLQSFASSRITSGISRIRSNRTGGVGGIDYAANGFRVGAYGGYQDDRSHLSGRGDVAHIQTYYAGGTLGWVSGLASIQIGADHAWHDIDTRRTITVAGLAGTATASPDASSTQVYAELGYRIVDGPITITPFVRNAYSWTRVKAFAETGNAAALTVARDHRGTDFASAGLRIGGAAPVTQGVTLLPLMSVAYSRGFGDLDGSSLAQIGGTGPAFAIQGASLGKDSLTLDTGFDLAFGQRLTLGAHGFGSTSRQWTDYGARASVGFRF